jgi:hypothetical protein
VAPTNFKMPSLPTEFPSGIRYKNSKKIPKGSYGTEIPNRYTTLEIKDDVDLLRSPLKGINT